jgi:hypothetical protein
MPRHRSKTAFPRPGTGSPMILGQRCRHGPARACRERERPPQSHRAPGTNESERVVFPRKNGQPEMGALTVSLAVCFHIPSNRASTLLRFYGSTGTGDFSELKRARQEGVPLLPSASPFRGRCGEIPSLQTRFRSSPLPASAPASSCRFRPSFR